MGGGGREGWDGDGVEEGGEGMVLWGIDYEGKGGGIEGDVGVVVDIGDGWMVGVV